MAQYNSRNSRRVYSSEVGRLCPECRQAKADCICKKGKPVPVGDGVVRVGRQTKGRKGKGVTVITGLPLGLDELMKLAKQLKKLCGSGGTIRDGVIEIQGDHRDRLVDELQKQGYKAKKSGG